MNREPQQEAGPRTPDPQKPTDSLDAALRVTLITVAVTAALMSAAAIFFVSARAALGVAIGGSIAVANLYVFARVGQAFVSRRGRLAPWAVVAAIKLLVLLGGVWLLLRTNLVPPLALTAGYASLIIGITLGSLFAPKSSDEETPPEDQNPDDT